MTALGGISDFLADCAKDPAMCAAGVIFVILVLVIFFNGRDVVGRRK